MSVLFKCWFASKLAEKQIILTGPLKGGILESMIQDIFKESFGHFKGKLLTIFVLMILSNSNKKFDLSIQIDSMGHNLITS